MRMIMHAKFPLEKFNAAVKDGTIEAKIQSILAATKPEAAYFTNYEGKRGAILIVNVEDPSKVPSLAEPWFLAFDAEVEFHIVMLPEDFKRAGLEAIGKKWS
jgi:hypothetical protein